MKPLDFALLVVLACIWGSAFTLITVVIDESDPLTIVAGRLVIGAVFMGLLALALGKGLPARSMWPVLLLLAVTNNILPFALITWAQEHIPSSLAATLNATMPLFTYLIAVAIASDRWTNERAAGVVVGFIGTAVLIGPDITEISSENTLAQFAVLVAALGYGGSTVIARERLHGEPIALSAAQLMFGAALSVPIALLAHGSLDVDVSAGAAVAWITLGIVPSGLAYIIFFGLIQRVSATSVSIVSYLIPVVATVLGWALLDERIGLNLFVGLALIIAGMAAVNGSLSPLLRRRDGGEPLPSR